MKNENTNDIADRGDQAEETEVGQERLVPIIASVVDLHDLAISLAMRTPKKDDALYFRELVEEMRHPAAKLCDLLLELGHRAGAEAVAGAFHFPLASWPLTYGDVIEAIAAAKMSQKELDDLAIAETVMNDHWAPRPMIQFFEDWQKQLYANPLCKFSVEEFYCHRLLLERIGLWDAPAAPLGCPGHSDWEWQLSGLQDTR